MKMKTSTRFMLFALAIAVVTTICVLGLLVLDERRGAGVAGAGGGIVFVTSGLMALIFPEDD